MSVQSSSSKYQVTSNDTSFALPCMPFHCQGTRIQQGQPLHQEFTRVPWVPRSTTPVRTVCLWFLPPTVTPYKPSIIGPAFVWFVPPLLRTTLPWATLSCSVSCSESHPCARLVGGQWLAVAATWHNPLSSPTPNPTSFVCSGPPADSCGYVPWMRTQRPCHAKLKMCRDLLCQKHVACLWRTFRRCSRGKDLSR